jgi:hypothetical protein
VYLTLGSYQKYKSSMAFSRMDPYYDFDSRAGSRKPSRPYSAKH